MDKAKIDSVALANTPSSREDQLQFKISRIKRQLRSAQWKAEKIAALRAAYGA